MVNPLWSWTLFAIGASGLYLITTGRTWPWLVNSLGQTVWIVYGAATRQWGFVASGCVYAVVHFVGWRRARLRATTATAGAR